MQAIKIIGLDIANGHTVKLMPPAYVKPFVKRAKNDAADAMAICEAVQRPNMRFMSIKAPEQQAGLELHRTRHLVVPTPLTTVGVRGTAPIGGRWLVGFQRPVHRRTPNPESFSNLGRAHAFGGQSLHVIGLGHRGWLAALVKPLGRPSCLPRDLAACMPAVTRR